MTTNYENLRKIVTGDITVKYICGNEIRRVSINQTPTHDELCLMIHRLFAHKISNVENIILRYTDEDGDLVVLSDDMDIIHAISQSRVLKVTVYDKENHPPPCDLWNQTGSQSLSSADIVRLKDELLSMRGVLDTLIGSLDSLKPSNDHQNGGEQAREETATYKRLSTNDMAEFLGESKGTSTPTAKISSPKPVSPSNQRQAGFSYPQAVAPTSANAPATPSSYHYQSPYQQQQNPVAPSYPQQQQHQQTAPPLSSSQPGYASAPSLGTSGYASNAPAPSPGSYMHSAHPAQAAQTGPDYYQNRPPPTQNNHTQNNPGSSNYPQQGPPLHAPQQAPPRPAYGYSETGRWR